MHRMMQIRKHHMYRHRSVGIPGYPAQSCDSRVHKHRKCAWHSHKSVLAAVVCAMLTASSCASDAEDQESPAAEEGKDSQLVLATTGIWADVVENIVCGDDMGDVHVEAIIPVGGDAHGFEPSLADRERMENADLIVANGLLLEENLEATLEAVEASGVPVFRIGDHINTIDYADEDDHDDHADEDDHDDHADEDDHDDHADEDDHDDHADEDDHDDHADEDDHDDHADEDDHDDHADEDDHHHHGAGGVDPHVWFDPMRVSAALPSLADLLVDEAGLTEAAVEACLTDYQVELEELDTEVVELLAGVPDHARKLITNHDALGYFADRYGFDVIATIIPSVSTLAETSPARLEELAESIEEAGVKAIFAESVHSTDDADALAARVGDVEVVSLFAGSLGPEGSGADTYTGYMRTNAMRIAEALG